MSHRSVWAWVAVVGVLTMGSAGRPASASPLRYELLPNSARYSPHWEQRSNASGQSIGEVRSFDPFTIRGYVSQSGERQDLGDLGGDYVVPFAINNRGQVVGTATLPGSSGEHNPQWRPFLWEDGQIIDLAPMHPDWSLEASHINQSGQVVGGQAGIFDGQAFLYDNGTFQSFGTLGGRRSKANWINEAGLIVGTSDMTDYHTREGTPVAMLVVDGVMHDLNRLTDGLGNLILPSALGITEDGWIQVIGYPQGGGRAEGFWLRPVDLDDLDPIEPDPIGPDPVDPGAGPSDPGSTTPIPEPASVALWLGLAASAVVWRRKRSFAR